MELLDIEHILQLQGSTTVKEFVVNDVQLMKETLTHSAIVIDRVNGLVHSFKPDNRPNQITNGVEIRSLPFSRLQYIYAYMDQEQLKATLDAMVLSNDITPQYRDDIIQIFKTE